ncbi:MAG: sigma 54-dependent Fis family transcriptional regulator [Myxococcota bacterium]|nr:sigma 54-dependent Fis family transcriptional regulator [Myxococcota bacterium]
MRPAATLRYAIGGRTHEARVERSCVIGSSPDAQVVVDAPTVSRLHCALEPRADGLWLRDLGSRNGTFAGGMLVREARLPASVYLRVGDVDIELHQDQEGREQPLWPTDQWGRLVGQSDEMRLLFSQLARVARTDATALILGPTGVGKELVVRSIHDASARASAPFVTFDCAAVAPTLVEAELFGVEAGAYTGADRARPGLAELANGGTLFLDEVGELPLELQPKLLRLLEDRTVRRLGGSELRAVDIRILAATHRDLSSMVTAGSFRADLFYRLAVLSVAVPPLAARRDDIPLLVRKLLPGDVDPHLRDAITEAASRRAFPGNVRELKAYVDRATLLGVEAAESLATSLVPAVDVADAELPPVDVTRPFKELRAEWADLLERAYFRRLIEQRGRSLSDLADASGLDRSYIYRLLRKHSM